MQLFRIALALFCTVFFWASAFVGIRIGLSSYSPGSLALFRFLVASLCMLLISYFMPHRKKVCWSDRLQLILLGFAAIGVYNICLNYGEMSVSAGVASFVIGLIPIFTLLLSILYLHERPGVVVYLGVIISLIGLALMAIAESTDVSINRGLLFILVAAWMGAIYTVLQKRFLTQYDPVTVTAWVIWGGTLLLMFFAPVLWQEIRVAKGISTISAVYMGIFPGALAYVAWSYVLSYFPASRAAMFLYILPVVSTLMGFILLDEQPAILSLTGGLLALAGAVCATCSGRLPAKK